MVEHEHGSFGIGLHLPGLGVLMIFPVTYRQLLDDPACDALLAEYAAECCLPELGEIAPQRDLYERMEASGGLQCFGVYKERLIGFFTVLVYVLPHYGRKIATTESLFLSKLHRSGRDGREMLNYIEAYANEKGCTAVLYTAPVGSQFSTLLSCRQPYRHSNNVFIRGLQ